MDTDAPTCPGAAMTKQAFRKRARRIIYCVYFCFLTSGALVAPAQEPAKAPAAGSESAKTAGQVGVSQKIVAQGIVIEYTLNPLQEKSPQPKAGEDAIIRFKVTDTTTGTPVKGLSLSAWLSLREGGKITDAKACKEKIQSFV